MENGTMKNKTLLGGIHLVVISMLYLQTKLFYSELIRVSTNKVLWIDVLIILSIFTVPKIIKKAISNSPHILKFLYEKEAGVFWGCKK